MDPDDFYAPISNATLTSPGLVSFVWNSILTAPVSLLITILLSPLFVAIATQLLSGRESEQIVGKNERTVWLPSYWLPVIGHGFQILSEPLAFMGKLRDESQHGIFALNLGATTHNIISDPKLVTSVMAQRESVLSFDPIAWAVVEKFFGTPRKSKPKYEACWATLTGYFSTYLMREPYLGKISQAMVRGLERNVTQMISFIDTEIDLQPWERAADASYVSDTETEINLMSLMRDMMGNASIPAVFGHALMEKYPDILKDVFEMDDGMYFFLMGLPSWFPWPGVMQAHLARLRIWRAMDDHQRVMDANAAGKDTESSWGDLDDVSDFILKRNETFRDYKLDIKERADPVILWALVINANMLVYWQILYILSTPGLVSRIREEIAPYATVTKPFSIGTISEAPKLTISHEGLSKKCPLLKSSYLEALRLSDQPWSVRKVASDVVLSGDKKDTSNPVSFLLKKGEYVTVPHELHMRDPKYFSHPDKFIPDRFIVTKEDGSVTVDPGTIRPYGGGPSICKGRLFAERECLSLIAGVLAYWDIEPVDKKGWVVPKMLKKSGVCRPVVDTRVRIRRRKFEWE